MKAYRKLASVLLALAMALSLLPAGAMAESGGPSLTVAGVDLSGGGTVDDRTDGVTGGTAAYDAATGTLTLTDFVYEGAGYVYQNSGGQYAGAIWCAGSLKLVLSGTSSVTLVSGEDTLYESDGVRVNGLLTVAGDGALTATGGGAQRYSYGVCCDDLTVTGGTLNACGGVGEDSCGVRCFSCPTVEGGALNALGGAESRMSYGIYGYEMTVAGGAVTATGGAASTGNGNGLSISCGAYCQGGFYLTGGTLTARGGTATNTAVSGNSDSRGVHGPVRLAGGSLTADAAQAGSSWAVAYGAVTVAKGCVYTDGVSSSDVDATNGQIVVLDAAQTPRPASVAYAYKSGAAEPLSVTFGLTDDAKTQGTFLSLCKATLSEPITPGEAVALDENGGAALSAGQAYLLVVKRDAQVTFSQSFGSYYGTLTRAAIPAAAIPQGYTAAGVDAWYFKSSLKTAMEADAPVTVTVGGIVEPETYAFSLTEDALEDGSFLSLWEAELGQPIALGGAVTPDENGRAELVAGRT